MNTSLQDMKTLERFCCLLYVLDDSSPVSFALAFLLFTCSLSFLPFNCLTHSSLRLSLRSTQVSHYYTMPLYQRGRTLFACWPFLDGFVHWGNLSVKDINAWCKGMTTVHTARTEETGPYANAGFCADIHGLKV